MIAYLSGKLVAKNQQFIILETNGIGFKALISPKTLRKLPKTNARLKIFCHTNIKQDGIDIYGFLDEKELETFEMLNTINGVGPKIALKILNIGKTDALLSAISSGRRDILTKSGIGKKTAERLILELKDKVLNKESADILSLTETDFDIEKALKNFGYGRQEINEAIKNIPPKIKNIEERLKAALKNLAKK